MVEVLKTNIQLQHDAELVLHQIHQTFPSYKANFDLDDCDHILRIASSHEDIKVALIMTILKNFGFIGSPLPDEISKEQEVHYYAGKELLN